MKNKCHANHRIATIGWGLLLIWWGICIVVDPITIGMSAVGTGWILLGVNAVRLLYGIPAVSFTTIAGLTAIVWGVLAIALGMSFGGSFAVLLIVIGAVMIVSLLPRPRTA